MQTDEQLYYCTTLPQVDLTSNIHVSKQCCNSLQHCEAVWVTFQIQTSGRQH